MQSLAMLSLTTPSLGMSSAVFQMCCYGSEECRFKQCRYMTQQACCKLSVAANTCPRVAWPCQLVLSVIWGWSQGKC